MRLLSLILMLAVVGCAHEQPSAATSEAEQALNGMGDTLRHADNALDRMGVVIEQEKAAQTAASKARR